MKYLVTGGAGFIGSNFIHYILDKYPDVEVVNLDKLTYAGDLKYLDKFKDDKRYRFIKGDIGDTVLMNELVSQTDIVVNFAAETHVDRSISGPAEFLKTNVLGTQVLLDAVVKYGKRIHHISTDEVFGDLPLNSKEKFNESTPYDPSSPYSASKAASDHLIRSYIRTFGLQATISNCSNNYGPHQHPEKLIPQTILFALQGKKIPVYGKGENVRDWIYVQDHNSAVDLIIQKGRLGETYLIGADSEKNNLEVVRSILKLTGKDESLIEFVADRPGHDLRYAIDATKIQKELGWKPTMSFEEGMKLTIDWYGKN
ncbi:MAG: dTDP-glucose 4,6-dehydratase [Candidatus Doudnabacteria bacterium]|nr:dTDP-glucose 4,6-dehydratase [Candidatus Doudnabacteria bacterium]